MRIVAGVDEVGRGSLVGPVYAAAVILNKSVKLKILKDSKTISKKRERCYQNISKITQLGQLEKHQKEEIDKLNIIASKLIGNEKSNIKS